MFVVVVFTRDSLQVLIASQDRLTFDFTKLSNKFSRPVMSEFRRVSFDWWRSDYMERLEKPYEPGQT